VEAWAQRYLTQQMDLVTHGEFVMVSLDENGKPTPVPPEE
jgi:acyl-CoA thioesterase YciA